MTLQSEYTRYTNSEPTVHLRGTPHVRGAKRAVGDIRKGLRDLAAVLIHSGWADDHPIDGDDVLFDVIDMVSEFGPAERHALRIAGAVLVKVARKNGYHL